MKLFNLHITQAVFICLTSTAIFVFSGCVQNRNADSGSVAQTNVQAPSSPDANTNANVNIAAQPAPAANLAGVPVTLPMLDALLSDDAAANELKSRTQINDEQVQKLRD